MQQAVRRRWYMEAYMTSGSAYEIRTSLAPVSASPLITARQLFPPSVVLKRPRSPPGPKSGPVAATNTTSGFLGSMTILLMCFDSRRPTCANVFPPSVDLYSPSPHDVLCRLFDSPVPIHTTFGLDCCTATAPIESRPRSCRSGVNCAPLLVVFQTPPCAVPT